MAINFAVIKTIPIIEVLAKRGISLRYNGDWGSARCPLPSHKSGDTDKTFQVNVRQNYFKCWSASCNEKAGKKGGDVINLVALLDNCSEYDAAKKLADAFHVETKRPAPHREERAKDAASENQISKRTISDTTSPSEKSNGYLHKVGLLLNDVLRRGDQEEESVYLKRVKKAVMTTIRESYLNGKREASGLPQ